MYSLFSIVNFRKTVASSFNTLVERSAIGVRMFIFSTGDHVPVSRRQRPFFCSFLLTVAIDCYQSIGLGQMKTDGVD